MKFIITTNFEVKTYLRSPSLLIVIQIMHSWPKVKAPRSNKPQADTKAKVKPNIYPQPLPSALIIITLKSRIPFPSTLLARGD